MTKSQWLIDLERDGYVVVPGVVSQEACAEFQEAAVQWIEKFGYGFKRDDPATWKTELMPFGHHGGMYNRYGGVVHEDFVWKIRTEPGILKTFAEIWGTDDLVVSFDGMNATTPLGKGGREDIEPTRPWPHIDQNVRRVDRFELYQGIQNLGTNGPDDGGLVVMKGSHLLHERHFAERGGWRPEGDKGEAENSYLFNDDEWEWFKKAGCEIVKVCANPGDLILWDSRTVHWNQSPTGGNWRFATYICYAPRSFMSEAALAKKKAVFDDRLGTTHWPHLNVVMAERDLEKEPEAVPRKPDGSVDHMNRRPFNEPPLSPEVLRLVGVRA
ncbi:hypothetical protein Q8F55_001568 [Vanrija albida]|uniref:Phytanoyl-CoA dioxygenase n=1 Tax=Vanrija albida TaxID=181172 RepID=A0ABR3QGC8_9TREE